MNSADKLKRFFKQAELNIDQEADEKVFQDVFQAQQKTIKSTPVRPVNIGRIIMKSQLTKIAAAAVVIIACIAGITMFSGTSGIVLANVLTQIEQFGAYVFQINLNNTSQIDGQMIETQEIQGIMIISQDYGMQMDMEISIPNIEDTLIQHIYLLPKEHSLITVMPAQKSYLKMDIDDATFEKIIKENYDPKRMLEEILECEYQNLGRSTLDGIEVEGFQTTDTKYLGGMYHKIDIKLWVDVEKQLPVKMELNFDTEGSTNTSISGIMSEFQWDVPVDEEMFKPLIPDDYISLTNEPIQITSDENSAIEGLKLFVELTDQYPESLDPMTIISQIKKIQEIGSPSVKLLLKEMEGLSQEEGLQRFMQEYKPIQEAMMFYMLLAQTKKDPAYYGDIVMPDDYDQVLMRWKVSENEYRVIFGGLHVETVTADVLAELEENLPN